MFRCVFCSIPPPRHLRSNQAAPSRLKYDRTNLDTLLETYFGGIYITEALTDEVFLVSYSFNAQEPRFYSKYNARKNPGVYNVTF